MPLWQWQEVQALLLGSRPRPSCACYAGSIATWIPLGRDRSRPAFEQRVNMVDAGGSATAEWLRTGVAGVAVGRHSW